jgi:hypothetical protein
MFASASLVLLCLTGTAGAALTHRYSFNDGTANDSVGGANGVLVNGPQIAGGRVNFGNNGFTFDPLYGKYVDLPNQVARTPALTLETWATYAGGMVFQEIASLGTGSGGERLPGAPDLPTGTFGTDYVAIIPHLPFNNQQGLTGTIRTVSVLEQQLVVPPPLPTGAEHHIAYVVDYPNRTAALYLDGAEVGRRSISIDPSTFDQVNDWLGRSQFSPDPFFNGSINEFRIYDHALSGAEVAASFAAGPDTIVPEPSSVVLALAGGLSALVLRRDRRRRVDPGMNLRS